MSKKILIAAVVIVVLLVGLGVFLFSQKQCPEAPFPPSSDWVLAWSDEFDGNELDLSKWIVLDRDEKTIVHEDQYFSPDEVYMHNGLLTIRSQKRDYGGKQYTSGRTHMRPEFSQTYGRFEVRAKLPTGNGMHSGFWLIGRDNWPPEIDVFEMLGRIPTTIFMTNQWMPIRLPFRIPRLIKLMRKYHQGKFAGGPDFSNDFHVFAAEWEPGIIRWYIDGVERFRSAKGVPCEPMFVILSSSVGDDWAREPDDSIFPQYYTIDYIRVYKK